MVLGMMVTLGIGASHDANWSKNYFSLLTITTKEMAVNEINLIHLLQ